MERDITMISMPNGFKKKNANIEKLNLWHKKRQATYIAPLNHIPLLRSRPGGFYRS